MLAEQKKTNKWLAQQLGKDPATVRSGVPIQHKSSLETLSEIAQCLKVDVRTLLSFQFFLFDMASEPYVSYGRKDASTL